MKRIKDLISDWRLPIFEIIVIIAAFIVSYKLKIATLILEIIKNNGIDIEALKYYLLAKKGGNVGFAIAIAIAVWWLGVRKYNKDKQLNKGNIYHDHTYFWYWYCSRIMGFKECNLQRVPIPMIFKLVIRDCFDEYYYGDDSDYQEKEDESIEVSPAKRKYTDAVNLVLSDTYPIEKEMLPSSVADKTTVWIKRDNKKEQCRCYSKAFVRSVQITVNNFPNNVTSINLFSTLNPKHCRLIAEQVFKKAGRGSISSLRVYHQNCIGGIWFFSEKGKKIY